MSEPLRVAQVVYSGAFYGVERYVTTLSTGLTERGCHVTVLGGPGPRMGKELRGTVQSWHPARSLPELLLRLAQLRKLDVIHAHMTHAEFAGALAHTTSHAALIATRHFAAPRGSKAGGKLAARLIRSAMAVQLACSENIARQIGEPCVVVRPGVPSREFVDRRDERTVLVAQRLEPQKDTGTALRAWAASGLGQTAWSLRVLGDGSERGALERLANRLGVADSCRFLGAVDDVQAHFEKASILVAPALDEPFGLSVVEAMATGLPVIATGSGGHLETVGLCPGAALFAPGDHNHAAALLQQLISDPGRRLDYGRGLQVVQRQHFSLDRQIDETLRAYEGAL